MSFHHAARLMSPARPDTVRPSSGSARWLTGQLPRLY